MADPHRKAKVTGKRRVLTLSERLKIIKAVEDSPHKSRTQMAIDLGERRERSLEGHGKAKGERGTWEERRGRG